MNCLEVFMFSGHEHFPNPAAQSSLLFAGRLKHAAGRFAAGRFMRTKPFVLTLAKCCTDNRDHAPKMKHAALE